MSSSRPVIFVALAVVLATLLPSFLAAAPTRYQLDASASRVEFEFLLGGGRQKGTMPISKAVILVDPANLVASRVDISLNVAGVRTPLPFVKPALIGRDVLDAARYPNIRFVSTRIELAPDGRISEGAKITGKLTMHGVTRVVTFDAGLFRAPGSAANDLSELTVKLNGRISRAAFGATGYGDLVGDTVGLNISAVIRVQN